MSFFNFLLTRTFLHIEGIDEKKERELWRKGYQSWQDVLNIELAGHPPYGAIRRLYDGVQQSYQAALNGDWRFFNSRLPSQHKWRAYDMLAEKAIYLDIETDGYFSSASITIIGIFAEGKFMPFIRGQNLEDGYCVCKEAPLVITYNGTNFDLPLVKALFPEAFKNAIHIDLALPLRKLGLKGGLKRVEELLGLKRPGEIAGLTGYDAVRLWRSYLAGSDEALELLLEYNRYDTINLLKLMEFVFQEAKKNWLVI